MPSATSNTATPSLILSIMRLWQGQRGSNPQPSVLETDALPVELCPCLSLQDLRYDSGAHGLAAFADGEAQTLLHRDRRDQGHDHLHVIARHHHLGALRQLDRPRDIGGPEVKLRPVTVEKRRVPPALFLRENIHFTFEF